MDKKSNNLCINLEFARTQSKSKEAKIVEFWKYLDKQDVLKPFRPTEVVEDESLSACTCDCDCNSDAACAATPKQTPTEIKKKTSKPTSKNSPEKKRDDSLSHLEKYMREDLRYANSVEVPYSELVAEIEEYEKRLLRCGCEHIETCQCKGEKV